MFLEEISTDLDQHEALNIVLLIKMAVSDQIQLTT